MRRLIDAELLKKNCKCTGKIEDNFKCVSLSELAKVIDNQPTAFDADKVTERLKEYLFEKYCIDGDAKIDEIVKGGGAE